MAAKLLAVKVEALKKKPATSAIPAEVYASVISPLGPGSSPSGVESFSKFDSIFLTYRPQIFSLQKSNPFLKHVKSSRGWQHFKDELCPLKVTSFSYGLFSSRM